MVALTVKNLSFRFDPKDSLFFDGIDMKLVKGRIHALTGKNGSGKSTFLSLLQKGNEKLYEGSIASEGSVALVDQRFDQMIADAFTFDQNLAFAKMKRFPSLRGFREKHWIPVSLERYGIHAKTPVRNLSGGQRQVLALLMAMQKRPSILLLDEPTAALDSTNTLMVFELLEELTALHGVTCLVICHDEAVSKKYCCGHRYTLVVQENGTRRLEEGGFKEL